MFGGHPDTFLPGSIMRRELLDEQSLTCRLFNLSCLVFLSQMKWFMPDRRYTSRISQLPLFQSSAFSDSSHSGRKLPYCKVGSKESANKVVLIKNQLVSEYFLVNSFFSPPWLFVTELYTAEGQLMFQTNYFHNVKKIYVLWLTFRYSSSHLEKRQRQQICRNSQNK